MSSKKEIIFITTNKNKVKEIIDLVPDISYLVVAYIFLNGIHHKPRLLAKIAKLRNP